MAVTCSMLSGSPVLGTSLEVVLGSLVPLGIIVASGEWFPSPRFVTGVLELGTSGFATGGGVSGVVDGWVVLGSSRANPGK